MAMLCPHGLRQSGWICHVVQIHRYTVTIMVSVDKAVEVSRGRIRYGTLIPKQGGAVEAFVSVLIYQSATGKAFVNTV